LLKQPSRHPKRRLKPRSTDPTGAWYSLFKLEHRSGKISKEYSVWAENIGIATVVSREPYRYAIPTIDVSVFYRENHNDAQAALVKRFKKQDPLNTGYFTFHVRNKSDSYQVLASKNLESVFVLKNETLVFKKTNFIGLVLWKGLRSNISAISNSLAVTATTGLVLETLRIANSLTTKKTFPADKLSDMAWFFGVYCFLTLLGSFLTLKSLRKTFYFEEGERRRTKFST